MRVAVVILNYNGASMLTRFLPFTKKNGVPVEEEESDLDIDPEQQRSRIMKRNSPTFAQRFFNEWIPLENRYFTETDIRARVHMTVPVWKS